MPRKYMKYRNLTHEHTMPIAAVAFSPRGSFIATAGLDCKVALWRVDDGELLHVWEGSSAVLSIGWMGDQEEFIVCGMRDGNLAFLRFTPQRLYVKGQCAHKYPLECLAVSSTRIASGAHHEVKVWDWNDSGHDGVNCFDLVKALPEPPKSSLNKYQEVILTSLHWTPHRRPLLMVTYMHHAIHFFDAASFEHVRTISLPGMIASTSLSPNGAHLAVSNMFKGFDIYKLPSEEPLVSFEHIDEPRSAPSLPIPLKFVHGSQALIGGSMSGKVGLWHIPIGVMQVLHLPKNWKVLALDEHAAVSGDPGNHRFLIATGIANEEGASSCIIWEGEELGTAEHLDGLEGEDGLEEIIAMEANAGDVLASTPPAASPTSLSARLLWMAVFAVAIAYALHAGPGLLALVNV